MRSYGRDDKTLPAWERVYAYVRERIMTGVLPAGRFLEEAEVSTAVGVSRTPVREAFQRLESDRFIDLLPRRGALIRAVTFREMLEIYETRRIIEAHVVRRIAEDRLPVPDDLDDLLVGLSKPSTFGDLRFQAEGNFIFHRTLVALLGNDVMLGVFDGLQQRQQRVAMTAINAKPGRMKITHEQHMTLLEALRGGRAEESVAILTKHLEPDPDVVSRLPDYIAPSSDNVSNASRKASVR